MTGNPFEIGDYVQCVDDKPKHSYQRAIRLKADSVYRVTDLEDDLICVYPTNLWWRPERFIFVRKSVPDDPYALDIADS